MKYQIIKTKINSMLLVLAIFVCISCNKDFEEPPAPPASTSGQTIWQIINASSNYTILKAAIARADSGQVGPVRIDSILNTNGNSLTLFAVDDNAFAISGITPVTIAVLPALEVQEILSYHIIPNALPAASIPATFPNTEMPTLLQLDPTNPLIKMNIFPWKDGAGDLFVNNIPIVSADVLASNGVIHGVAAVINPPSELLAQIIYGDTTLTYLTAAIARADSGQVGLNRFDSLLKYPLINMTVLAPTDSAFQAILYQEIYGTLLQEGVPSGTAAAEAGVLSSSPTVFSNPALYGVLTAQTVRGIVAYHILAVPAEGSFEPLDRVFSVNFPTTPGSFVTTLVNASVGGHPGIMAQATFTGPFVTSLQFTGLGTFPPGGNPYSGAPANTIVFDEIGVNGVVHKIDKVLLPE
ncbi:MAG TPA: fasciclin domain-containing protein [Puia sp.]|nr:fasciclin domain-containing protein [Puia sp.]